MLNENTSKCYMLTCCHVKIKLQIYCPFSLKIFHQKSFYAQLLHFKREWEEYTNLLQKVGYHALYLNFIKV